MQELYNKSPTKNKNNAINIEDCEQEEKILNWLEEEGYELTNPGRKKELYFENRRSYIFLQMSKSNSEKSVTSQNSQKSQTSQDKEDSASMCSLFKDNNISEFDNTDK